MSQPTERPIHRSALDFEEAQLLVKEAEDILTELVD